MNSEPWLAVMSSPEQDQQIEQNKCLKYSDQIWAVWLTAALCSSPHKVVSKRGYYFIHSQSVTTFTSRVCHGCLEFIRPIQTVHSPFKYCHINFILLFSHAHSKSTEPLSVRWRPSVTGVGPIINQHCATVALQLGGFTVRRGQIQPTVRQNTTMRQSWLNVGPLSTTSAQQ